MSKKQTLNPEYKFFAINKTRLFITLKNTKKNLNLTV